MKSVVNFLRFYETGSFRSEKQRQLSRKMSVADDSNVDDDDETEAGGEAFRTCLTGV